MEATSTASFFTYRKRRAGTRRPGTQGPDLEVKLTRSEPTVPQPLPAVNLIRVSGVNPGGKVSDPELVLSVINLAEAYSVHAGSLRAPYRLAGE